MIIRKFLNKLKSNTELSFSVVTKIFSSLFSFIIAWILLNKFPDIYGQFVVFYSLLAFVSLFDFGIGFNLRNKLSSNDLYNKRELKFKILKNTFLIFILGVILILFLSFTLNYFNINDDYIPYLYAFVGFVSLKHIDHFFIGLGKVRVIYLVNLLTRFLILIGVLLLNFNNVQDLSLFWIGSELLLLFLLNIWVFKNFNKFLINRSVSKKKIVVKKPKEIYFFLAQVTGVIMYGCYPLLLSYSFNNQEIALFDFYMKLFSPVLIIANITNQANWKNYSTSKNLISFLNPKHKESFGLKILFFLSFLILIFLTLISRFFIDIHNISLLFSIFFLVLFTLFNKFSFSLLNANGEIKLYLLFSILMSILIIMFSLNIKYKNISELIYIFNFISLLMLIINVLIIKKIKN